jgi:hypothetical protein
MKMHMLVGKIRGRIVQARHLRLGLCFLPLLVSFACQENSESPTDRAAKKNAPTPGAEVDVANEGASDLNGSPRSSSPEGQGEGNASADPIKISQLEGEAQRLVQSNQWPAERFALYKKWAAEDPGAAIAHAMKNNPGASTACVSSVLEGWMEKEQQAALDWVEQQPALAERSLWMATLARSWKESELEKLGDSIASLAEKPSGSIAIEAYVSRIIEEDPSKAFSWIQASIEKPDVASHTITENMKSWASRDTEKASGWLAEIPTTATWRDDAITGLIQGVSSLDRETAIQWAEAMGDVQRREDLLGWIGKQAAASAPQ